jgi:trimeric autotransporter adhesin
MQDLTAQVTWSSANPGIATISNAVGSEGLVNSLAQGSVTLSASFAGLGGSANLTVSPAALTSISVTPTNPSIPLGIPLQLTATGRYTDGNTVDLTAQATWDSSAPAVATVSNAAGERGLVTPVTQNAGATIRASFAGQIGSTTVTVTMALLSSLTISPSQPSQPLGFTQSFTVTGVYSDQSTVDLTAQATWSSSNSGVATISNAAGSEGLANPIATGTTTIRADFGGQSASTPFTVTPATLLSLSISPPAPTVAAGLMLPLSATGHFSDLSTQDLTSSVSWESSNAGVATVVTGSDGAGTVSGIAQGSATISARSGQVTAMVTLTVSAAQLQTLTIAPNPVAFANGTQIHASVQGHFSDGSNQDLTAQVTWTSDDETLAMVSNVAGSEGLVSSVAPGSTTLEASLGGVTGKAPLVVKDVMLQSITITPATPTIGVGQSLPLTATGTFDDTSTQDLTRQASWSSFDETLATVANANGMQGLCSGIMPGTVTVSASMLGQTGSTDVTVQ